MSVAMMMTYWRLPGLPIPYIRLVRQAPALSKCILLSTSVLVRGLMKDWVLSDSGDKWSVKLDTRDLGEHLDTTYQEEECYPCWSGSWVIGCCLSCYGFAS